VIASALSVSWAVAWIVGVYWWLVFERPRRLERGQGYADTLANIAELEREMGIGLMPGECDYCRTIHPPSDRHALRPPRTNLQHR